MAFDVEGARKAGYSEAEIANYLASQKTFDIAGARKAGYGDQEIIGHLLGVQKPKDRTYLEAAKDVGAGVVSGVGALTQLPGQLYGLATGDFSDTGLTKVGREIREAGEAMKSEELKRREAERAAKIKEAGKEGEFKAGVTAFMETIKDPALLSNFIAEQAPNLLPGLAVARGLGIAGAGARTAVSGAVGTGAVQQGADVGAGTYEQLYKEMVSKGVSEEEAAGRALGYARATGAGAAVISLLAQRLPGGRAIEEAMAKVPVKGGRFGAAFKGGAGETVSEMIEEGGGKIAQNLAGQQVDPTRSITEGLGETMGMAAVGGLGLGTAAGLTRGREAPPPEAAPPEEPAVQPAAAPVEPAPLATLPRTIEEPSAAAPTPEPPPPPPPGIAQPPEEATKAMQNYWEGKPEDFGLSLADIQNRDRTKPASIQQMMSIARQPDYNRLSVSRDFGAGAPVVISDVQIDENQLGRVDVVSASDGTKIPVQYAVVDAREITPSNRADGTTVEQYADPAFEGIRPVAGNGRIAGLQELYRSGPYTDYVRSMIEDQAHGVEASVIDAMEQPVLVRIMPKSSLTPDIADKSNVGGQLGMSPTEQAKIDMGRFDLQGIEFLTDGSPTIASLRQFVASMPKEEQAQLMNRQGQPTPLAQTRLANALFARAYENDALIDLYAETTDPEALQILRGMAIAAPAMSNLQGSGDYDVRNYVTKAAELAVNARRQGKDLGEYIDQGDIEMDPLTREVVSMFAANKNAPRRIGDSLIELAAEANKAAAQATAEPDMFGNVAVATPLENVFGVLRTEPRPPTKPKKPAAPKPPEGVPTPPDQQTYTIEKPLEQIAQEVDGMDVVQLSNWLVKNAPNGFAKTVAEAVRSRVKQMNDRGIQMSFGVIKGRMRRKNTYGTVTPVPVGLGQSPKYDVRVNGPNVPGQQEKVVGTNYRTLLHEMIHLATMGQLYISRQTGKARGGPVGDLEILRKFIMKKVREDRAAGRPVPAKLNTKQMLANIDELVAYGMVEIEIQKYLAGIEYKRSNGFKVFVEAIRKLLGINKNQQSALERLVALSEEVLTTPIQDIDTMYKMVGRKFEKENARDTRTSEFRKWFGKSKVVDENGQPQVVYHGTVVNQIKGEKEIGNIYEFDRLFSTNVRAPSIDTVGIWFSTSPSEGGAEMYAGKAPGSVLYPVYLSIKDPHTTTFEMMLRRARLLENGVDDGRRIGEKEVNAYRKWLKSMGKDGIHIVNDPGAPSGSTEFAQQDAWIALEPNQIKSVFNKRPTEAPGILEEREEEPTVTQKAKAAAQKALQKRTLKKSQFDGVDDDLYAALEPVFAPEKKTIIDKIDGMRDGFWQKLAQGVADQYRSIKDISEEAYMKARMSKTIDGALEGILFNGQVKLTDGALDIAPNTKGLLKVLEPVGNEVDRYQIWVALQRDAQLVAQGKAPSVNREIVARRAELAAGKIGNKSRLEVYKQVQKDMNELNRSVLRIAYKQGIIDKEAFKVYSRDINYIPFYKVMDENGDVQGAATKSGLINQYFSKALKGGEKPFGDLMENTLRNWSHILSASMKNEAANATVRAAMDLGGAYPNLKVGLEWRDGKVYSSKSGELVNDGKLKPEFTTSGKGMIKTMIDGKPAYFDIVDPMLLESIMSIGYMGPQSKFVDVARDFKNMLQFGVTLSPAFKIRNLFRDSISAIAVTDLKKNPFANVIQGWTESDRNNPAHISALAGGAIFNFGSAYEGDQAKLIKRLLDSGVKGETILDNEKKIEAGLRTAWRAYQDWGNKSEAANRMALYKQLKEQGYSHLEASFYARDMLDFSMQGSWPTFRFLTQVVPFLNARVQGLYKLGRDGIIPTSRVIYNTATGKPIEATDKQRAEQFSIVMGAVVLASMMLYLTFKDDEEFKKREQWDRDNFWWIKIPGMESALRVPKPFEIGAMGTLAERTLEQIIDQGVEGKVFRQSLSRMLTDTFAINPMPQVFKPLVDLYANKDSFTGAPIETAGMERLSKAERIAERTSPLAIGLSQVANVFLPEATEVSPVQVDYAIKGYLGWLGGTISATSHYAMMPFSKSAYPDANWTETMSMGFIKTLPATQSKYVTAFYENNKEISQAYADMRHFAQLGQADKVQEILAEKGDKIAMAKFYDNASKDMAKMRQVIQAIRNDETMTGAQKKEEIDRMKVLIGELAQQMEEARIEVKKSYAAAQ
jgi:hypothetical protein